MSKVLKAVGVLVITGALAMSGSGAAHAAAGNQQGTQKWAGGKWLYGVSSTVVWSQVTDSSRVHRAGTQAAYSIGYSPWKNRNVIADHRQGRVAYDNYQFMQLGLV